MANSCEWESIDARSEDAGSLEVFGRATKLEQARPFWLRLINRLPRFSFDPRRVTELRSGYLMRKKVHFHRVHGKLWTLIRRVAQKKGAFEPEDVSIPRKVVNSGP